MAVRFKFRSSVNFDSIPIGEQPSISVRDLKSKVLLVKNLHKTCHDFDLQFSDAITGQEYVDEDFQIPSGSCVIIKRVPPGTTHKDVVQTGSFREFQSQPTKIDDSSSQMNIDLNELDEFGVDFYSLPSDLDIGPRIQGDKRHIGTERFPELFKGDVHKIVVSDLREDNAGGLPHAGTEVNISEMKIRPKTEDYTKLEKGIKVINPSLQKADLPLTLKCPICDYFIKDAIMIPCCQQSFCQRCIRRVLVEKGSCPKCYSTKCTPEELLPNVSLRLAIEHFLESQMLMTGSHYVFHQYASDRESEIHIKDVSYNLSTHKKDTEIPQSPSPTETGSNEITGETAHNLLLRENSSSGCIESHFSHLGAKPCEKSQMVKEGPASACPELVGACSENLGKGQNINDEVESISKKRGLKVITGDAGGDKYNSLMAARRRRKGNISCYMCGSSDHLIRECPATSCPNPMLKRGISMLLRSMRDPFLPYWNATSFHHTGPFTNQYGNHAMMPFNTWLFPGGPCTHPTYMPTIYGAMPSFRASSLDNGGDFSKRHQYKQQAKRSHHHKSYLTEEKVVMTSHDRHSQQRKRKHNLVDDGFLYVDDKHYSSNGSRGWWPWQRPDQTSSEVEDVPCSSCCSTEERHKHHHRSSKREKKRKRERERDKILDNKRRHCKRYRHSESDLEQSFSTGKIRKQKLNTRDSGHSKQRVKSDDDDDDLIHECSDRWRRRSGLDDSDEGYDHYYKWKRAR